MTVVRRYGPARDALPARPAPNEVTIWQVDLDDPAWPLADLRALLSADEQERCARLRTSLLQQRFVVRRGVLRLLLGDSLGLPPALLRFRLGAGGKPELHVAEGKQGLHFNLSDSGACTLVAVTGIGPIGVDVEAPAPLPDLELVARRVFSLAEQGALAQLPEQERLYGFYRAWTRKEALVKAEGSGITLPLQRFTVSLGPGEPAVLLSSDLPLLRAFELADLPLAGAYIGACAVQRAAEG